MTQNKKNLLIDFIILIVSVIFAIWLGQSDALEKLLVATSNSRILGSFVGGLFFTSIFTTAPSIIILGEISQHTSAWLVAFFGALGALAGDMLMFKFLKDRLARDFYAVFHIDMKREAHHFRLFRFRWLVTLIGALIIASPFPDELGLAILGFSNTNTKWVAPISYVFNFLGIAAIALLAK
jgi:hypothetical protein